LINNKSCLLLNDMTLEPYISPRAGRPQWVVTVRAKKQLSAGLADDYDKSSRDDARAIYRSRSADFLHQEVGSASDLDLCRL
jgi:hypothetical protein